MQFGVFCMNCPAPQRGICSLPLPPQKNNDNCPTNARGDAHAWNRQSHNQYNIHLEGAMIKAWLHRFVAISSGDRCLSLKILFPFLLPLAAIRSLKLSVWTCGRGKQDSASYYKAQLYCRPFIRWFESGLDVVTLLYEIQNTSWEVACKIA